MQNPRNHSASTFSALFTGDQIPVSNRLQMASIDVQATGWLSCILGVLFPTPWPRSGLTRDYNAPLSPPGRSKNPICDKYHDNSMAYFKINYASRIRLHIGSVPSSKSRLTCSTEQCVSSLWNSNPFGRAIKINLLASPFEGFGGLVCSRFANFVLFASRTASQLRPGVRARYLSRTTVTLLSECLC